MRLPRRRVGGLPWRIPSTLLGGVLLFVGTGVSEAGQCTYSLSPTYGSYSAAGGSNVVTMTAGASCNWSATTAFSWLHPVGSGTGTGTFSYTVDANPSTSVRSGTITAGGKTFTVNQGGVPIPLGVALDNTNLVWTTSTDYPWAGTNTVTYDGVDAAAAGNHFISNSVSWVQTTVVGPGTLSFWWKVDSDVTPLPPATPYSYDTLQFLLNGEVQDEIMGLIDWNYRTYDVPAGTNLLTWQYVKDAQYNSGNDRAWLDQVGWNPAPPIGLQDALNSCGAQWTTDGNTNTTYWAGQTNVTHDGQAAAQSGAIYTTQETWMQAIVSGATNVSFWWKVSSQTNYDFLEFYTNGVLARRISGEVNWQSNYFRLPAATNTLKWRYAMTNGVYVSQGQNHGWVDQVTFGPPDMQPPVITLNGPNPLTVECHASFSDPGATALDNCAGPVDVITNSNVNPDALGTYTISYFASDPNGNAATNTRTVMVVDTTPPAVLFSITNLSLNAASDCQAALPDLTGTSAILAVDSVSSVTVTQSPLAGTLLGLGANPVVLTARDSAGNATNVSVLVTVVDATPPSLVCPPDVVATADAGQSFASNVALGLPVVSDNCALAVVTNNAPPSFPVGTNLVTWTAGDNSGNTFNSIQKVIVNPAPDLPHSITSMVRHSDATVTLTFAGTAGASYAVQISSNLTDWVSIATNTAGLDGTWTYNDTDAPTAPLRFYRSARR